MNNNIISVHVNVNVIFAKSLISHRIHINSMVNGSLMLTKVITNLEKVNFRSQILERPSIGEYWNTFGVPALPENVTFMFFRMCWCYSEAYNTGMQKWFSIVQYSCTSIWDLKYTFSKNLTS